MCQGLVVYSRFGCYSCFVCLSVGMSVSLCLCLLVSVYGFPCFICGFYCCRVSSITVPDFVEVMEKVMW